MDKIKIAILLGTAREDAESKKVFDLCVSEAEEFGFEVIKSEVLGLSRTLEESEKTKEWSEKMKQADGLIIVSPEYNHGYPGELKLTLDALYEEYNQKPLAICGVSSGGLGGARVIQQLRLVSIELQMVPIKHSAYFSNVGNFDPNNQIQKDKLQTVFSELKWYAQTLKAGRNRS